MLLWGIIVVAAILRIAAIQVYHSPLVSDDKDYDAIARSLVHGDGYVLDGKPTAYRLPAYPLVLAGTYYLFGGSDLPVKILQTCFDLLSCLLLFLIGRKLFSTKVGLAAAAILALFPIQILYVTHLMTETMFTTIFLMIVWMVIRKEEDSRQLSRDCVIGLLTGTAVLFRTTALLLPVLIFIHRWKLGYELRTNLRSFALISVMMALVVSPWLIRNVVEFQRLSLTSNAGVNFWMGNHPGASGAYSFPKTNNPLADVDDDFVRSDLGFKLGTEFIMSHPIDAALVVGKKFAHFFAADYWLMMMMEYKPDWASAPNSATVFNQLSLSNVIAIHIPFVLIILLGTFALVSPSTKDSTTFFFLRAILLYWLAVHLVIYADARYRFPIVPIIILAAAYGWFSIREKTFHFSRKRFALLTILYLLFIGGWLGEIITIRSRALSSVVYPKSALVQSRTLLCGNAPISTAEVPETR